MRCSEPTRLTRRSGCLRLVRLWEGAVEVPLDYRRGASAHPGERGDTGIGRARLAPRREERPRQLGCRPERRCSPGGPYPRRRCRGRSRSEGGAAFHSSAGQDITLARPAGRTAAKGAASQAPSWCVIVAPSHRAYKLARRCPSAAHRGSLNAAARRGGDHGGRVVAAR
jgi:hypothetical protein